MKTITFFICDQMLATSVALPMELLRAAESMARASRLPHAPKLNITLASIDGKPAQSHTGLNLQADCSIFDVENSDITYLPALWRNPKPILKKNSRLSKWLVDRSKTQSTIAGVGTGCCYLAEAGLLNNQPATTHWFYFDEFQKSYPKVNLKREFFITRAGNIFCTGSVTSLADLTVFFLQNLYNSNIARSVERHFFHQVRQQYSIAVENEGELLAHPDESIAEIQSWMKNNSHLAIEIKDLAKKQKMSLRTFNRHFKDATNTTPLQYLQNIRMRNARELLQTSNLSIAEIAFRCGYQDMGHFSKIFKKHFGTTPGNYKTTVRSKLFTVE